MQQNKQLLSSGTSLHVSPKLASPPLLLGCNGWLCLSRQSMQTHQWGQSALAVIPHLLPSTCYSPWCVTSRLAEHSKSTRVIFDCKAFSSETELVLWFSIKNPSGEGLVAWVDIISIWAFGMPNHIDSTQWFTELHCSKLVGLEGSMDIACIHLMSIR